jgi:hypothetical protein
MSEAPIIAATYHSWKMLEGRSVLQLVFEVPLEQQQDVLMKLGAPRPDRADWYGIVRLKNPPTATAESRPPASVASATHAASGPGGAIQGLVRPDAERRRYAAFLRSVRDYPKNFAFQMWVARKTGSLASEKEAAEYIKWRCGIDTRLDIKTDEAACEKFLEMETEFAEDTPGLLAERRG